MNGSENINLLFSETENGNYAYIAQNYRNNFIAEELEHDSPLLIHELIKPDALTILIITGGTATITFDQQKHEISAYSVIRAIPEHHIHFEETSSDFRGKVISVNRDMVNLTTTGFSPNTYLYIRQNPILELEQEEPKEILELFHLIKRKVQRIQSGTDEKVFYCLIMALFYELAGFINKKVEIKPQLTLSHKENLYKKFLLLLRENIRKEHRVSFYANQLCLTPQYISSVLKELSGMTANRWIDEMLLTEAKLLLFSAEDNIQQIADKLNFPDQSSFGKFFKKMTGMSPSNYKRQKK